jgi:hypothetical protein
MLTTVFTGGKGDVTTGGVGGVGAVGDELLQPASTLAHKKARHTDRILRLSRTLERSTSTAIASACAARRFTVVEVLANQLDTENPTERNPWNLWNLWNP